MLFRSCAVASAVLLAPWAILVQRSEGLFNYVIARAYINSKWAVGSSPFTTILSLNPLAALTPDPSGDLGTWLPGRRQGFVWMAGVTLLATAVVLLTAVVQAIRQWRWPAALSRETAMLFVAGALLALVQHKLYREEGYYVLVAPLSAALAARYLAGRLVSRVVASSLLIVSLLVMVGGFREYPYLIEILPRTFARVTAAPAIDGLMTPAEAAAFDGDKWRGKMDFGLQIGRAHV